MSVQRKQRLIHAVEMLAGVTVLCAGVTLGIIAGLGQTTSTAAASAIAGACQFQCHIRKKIHESLEDTDVFLCLFCQMSYQ